MSATLRSNDGESCVTLQFGTVDHYTSTILWESSIGIEGHLCDGNHDLFPLRMSMEGIGLCIDAIASLQARIADWVNAPLDALLAEKLDGEFELAALNGQRLTLCFGAQQDTVLTRKPTVTLRFSGGALSGEFHFITDPSCLALFSHALSECLASLDLIDTTGSRS